MFEHVIKENIIIKADMLAHNPNLISNEHDVSKELLAICEAVLHTQHKIVLPKGIDVINGDVTYKHDDSNNREKESNINNHLTGITFDSEGKIHGLLPHYDPANPSHYKILKQQPIEIMQQLMSHDQFIGFLWGNVIKYSLRLGYKDSPASDAAKLAKYTKWLSEAENEQKIAI